MKTSARIAGLGRTTIALLLLVFVAGPAHPWGGHDGKDCHEGGTCTKDTDCGDDDACTADACTEGSCVHTAIDGCVPCTCARDCDDGNPCTGDACTEAGTCSHRTIADCIPCTGPDSCDDHNPCTDEFCGTDGTCKMTLVPTCAVCETAARCDDGDTCTEDACTEGKCTHKRAEECCSLTENCHNGVDDDCDGRVDCEDPGCAAAPECAKPAEICGNCIDDDGNGLTDFEDPACCPALDTFAMKLMKGRIIPQGETSRLRLRTALARRGRMHVNPMQQDVFVQMRPEEGTDVFCAKVPSSKFMKLRGSYNFWDPIGLVVSAKGLSDMKVSLRRNGTVRLKTHGKRAQLRPGNEGMLQVVVGFRDPAAGDAANVCSTVMQPFRLGAEGRLLAP
jgi:hypothetical protein